MQNKPNLLDAQMNISSVLTKDYENKPRLPAPGKQTQSNPISKGAPMLLCGALLRTRGVLIEQKSCQKELSDQGKFGKNMKRRSGNVTALRAVALQKIVFVRQIAVTDCHSNLPDPITLESEVIPCGPVVNVRLCLIYW